MKDRYVLLSKCQGPGACGFTTGMFKNPSGPWVRYDSVDHDHKAREFYDTVRSMSRDMNHCWCDIQSYIEDYFVPGG